MISALAPTVEQALEELIQTRPPLHGPAHAPTDWGLDGEVLRWLADHVEPGWRTLETGCGHSSVVFAIRRSNHTIVAPNPLEHDRIRAWCEERGIATDSLTTLAEVSQRALPALGEGTLDLGLIDGSHAFPTPFMDWYYIAERLREGGYLLVDDTHIPTCRLLRDFLAAEEGRWDTVVQLGDTAVFRKLSGEGPIPMTDWAGQPWVVAAKERQRPTGERLRAALRPRTRAKALAARLGRGSATP